MNEFAESIIGNKKPQASGEEILEVVKLIDAIKLSSKEKRLVEFD